MSLLPTLLTILGVGFMIFIHEAGHYLAARAAGVRVLVFSLGFGPRVFGFVRNGTDYRLSLVPVGGFVMVAGAEDFERRRLQRDDLNAKSFSARMLYYSGGVIMNLLFALIAFPIVFQYGVPFTAPVIGNVTPGGTAWHADLRSGDRVLSMNGKPVHAFENLRVEVALAGARPVEFEIQRSGKILHKSVRSEYDSGEGLRRIGVAPAVEDSPPEIVVPAGTPAHAAGLRTGDRVRAIDGAVAGGDNISSLLQAIEHRAVGSTVQVEFSRGGAAPQTVSFIPASQEGAVRIGIAPIRSRVRAVRLDWAPLAALGLRTGDEIESIDDRPYVAEDLSPWREGPSELRMRVRRGNPVERIDLRATMTANERAELAEHVAVEFDTATTGALVVVRPDDPAARAGMRDGDRLTVVDDTPVTGWVDVVKVVRAFKASALRCVVLRGTETVTLTVEPAKTLDPGFGARVPYLRQTYSVDGVSAAIGAGFGCSVDLIKQLYVTIKEMVIGDVSARNLGGIIQISRASYANAEWGFARFIYFLAMFSINLAFINVLPIPVLDGGHMLFLLIERIKGSPVSARMHGYSLTLGLVFVVGLLVFVMYNDISRLFS